MKRSTTWEYYFSRIFGPHRKLQGQLAKEGENTGKRNKIRRAKENREAINASRQALKEQPGSDVMKTTGCNLKKPGQSRETAICLSV
jgi:hypothetical protein